MKRFLVWLNLALMVLLIGIGHISLAQAEQKLIALTFDDGPRHDVLTELLPLLKEYNIKATFFINGYHFSRIDEKFIRHLWIARNIESKMRMSFDYFGPDPFDKANKWLIFLMKQMSEEGHSIQNHSYSHKDSRKMEEINGKEAILEDIVANGKLIELLTDRKPTFFRPPFGVIWPALKKDIENLGYRVVGADVDSNDYLNQAAETRERIVPSVLKAIEEREKQSKFCHILLFHELSGTVKIMPVLIQELKDRGYEFETIEKVWLCQN